LRANTIVVQNSLTDTRHDPSPTGWHQQPGASGLVTVWTRNRPLAGNGRLAYANVDVPYDEVVDQVGERLTATGPGALTFARLAWPGYSATENGHPITVRSGPDGLLAVDVPEKGQVTLSWSPPGWQLSALAFGLGLLLAIGLGVRRA
jgi:hypothetical protein